MVGYGRLSRSIFAGIVIWLVLLTTGAMLLPVFGPAFYWAYPAVLLGSILGGVIAGVASFRRPVPPERDLDEDDADDLTDA